MEHQLKVLLLVFLFHAAESGSSWEYLGSGCVGARNNQYLELAHTGSSNFIGAIKLFHTGGYVGCYAAGRSNWGCSLPTKSDTSIIMTVTDSNNQVLYPSPRMFKMDKRSKGWYKLPGYTAQSPELVFADFGNPQYLKQGEKIRIWYSEDLYDYTESDNHGKTCMQVYIHSI